MKFSKSQGTGLGLSHAREYVVSVGGDISLQSEINKGTTVQLLLPCEE